MKKWKNILKNLGDDKLKVIARGTFISMDRLRFIRGGKPPTKLEQIILDNHNF